MKIENRKCRRIANRAIKQIQQLNKQHNELSGSVRRMRSHSKKIKNRPAKMTAKFRANVAANNA